MTSINPARFIRGWLASSLLVWFLVVPLIIALIIPAGMILRILESIVGAESFIMAAGRVLILFMMPGALIGFCIAEMQQSLTEAHLGWFLYGWSRMSAFGGCIGGFVIFTLITTLPGMSLSDVMPALMPLFMLCIGIGQYIVMRQHVQNAWLWIAGNFIGGLLFSNIFFSQTLVFMDVYIVMALSVAWVLAGLAQGAIMVYVLLWLYETPLPEEFDELAPVPIPVRRDDR
ncbi:MAG: hypothetical protein ACPG7F_01540 [Aggregatilineales bacterium]